MDHEADITWDEMYVYGDSIGLTANEVAFILDDIATQPPSSDDEDEHDWYWPDPPVGGYDIAEDPNFDDRVPEPARKKLRMPDNHKICIWGESCGFQVLDKDEQHMDICGECRTKMIREMMDEFVAWTFADVIDLTGDD
jgi:hypothetical protein